MSAARLSLGTAQWGMPYGLANRGELPEESQVRSVLETAARLGITALDTAAAYGCAEERVGRLLRQLGLQQHFEIATKLPPLDGQPPPGGLDAWVEASLTASLGRLDVDHVDAYLVHYAADLEAHGRALVEALTREQARGRARRIGVSVYGPKEAELAFEHPELALVQHPLSLLDQRLLVTGLLGRLSAQSTAVQARSVYLQGALALGQDELPGRATHLKPLLSELESVLAPFGIEPIDAALPFVLATTVERVLIGVDDAAQLAQDVSSASTTLPDGLADAVHEHFRSLPSEAIDPRVWSQRAVAPPPSI